MRARRSVLALLALATSVLTACWGGRSPVATQVVAHTHGVPAGFTTAWSRAVYATTPIAAWAGPDRIYVIAWGSGSCPHLPTYVQAARDNEVIVKTQQIVPPGTNACTADLGPTTSTVVVPKGIDVTRSVRVSVDGVVTTLAPR